MVKFEMKRKLIYILLVFALKSACGFCPTASAQHYFGVRGGYGGGTSRIYPPKDMSTIWGLYHGGISWKYFTKERYVGATEVDLLFMQQGYQENSPRFSVGNDQFDSTGYYKRKVNTVMLPIFWHPHAYLFQRKMRVFLNLGVTFSYIVSQEEETGSKLYGTFSKGDYKMKLTRDNRWGYGLCGGGGAGWSFGRFEVMGEVRYYIGYSDIMKNRNKYEENPLRSPLDGLQASFGVYYRFGNKGILARPSRKVEAKMQEAELRRLQKIEEKQAAKRQDKKGTETDGGDIDDDTGGVIDEGLETDNTLNNEDSGSDNGTVTGQVAGSGTGEGTGEPGTDNDGE